MTKKNDGIQIGDFLASRGGPFYDLQRRLGLLREGAFRARSRALIFVTLAWGVPLIMTLIAGNAFGTYAEAPYLLDLRSWGRFFIAVGLFVLRILWRLFVWSMLLRELAALELRLIATHPDGHGGLAFLGHYPNAYTMFVFAISCALGSIIAHELLDNTLNIATYGYLMGGWLVLMLTLFTFPLASFLKPLSDMKERTLLAYSGQATRYHRAVERNLVGENICASGNAERATANKIPDPSKELASARNLSVFLINREGLLPISAAALMPLVAAGATQLPVKEIMNVLKHLLLP